MAQRRTTANRHNQGADPVTGCSDIGAGSEYKVGPGRPPKEHQFKPGQSGNPNGAKRKPKPAIDIKGLLESALGKKITIKQGDEQRLVTMAAAGIEQLVAQYARGDRHARRDLFALAARYDVDLMAGQTKALEDALAANHQAILEAYTARQYDRLPEPKRVLAPPELLDDDPEDGPANAK